MNDNELREHIRLDGKKGFKVLMQEYQDMVFTVAWSYVRGQSDAEDITQEVFIKIFRKIGSFRWSSRLSTWIYRITINTCHDHARRKKMADIPVSGQSETLSAPFRQQLESQETREEIRKAVHSLPERYRDVVILRYTEKRSCREIASILQCSVASVEVNLFRARGLLKELLEPFMTKEVLNEL